MGSAEESFSFLELLNFADWSETLINCRDVRKLNIKYNSSDLIDQLRVTSIIKSSKPWFQCFSYVDFLQVIIQFLRLNVSFVEPNHDFDGTLGWYNQTNSTGPLKMMDNNQVDYIVDKVITNEMLWNPNLILTTTNGNHEINFLLRKKRIKFSISSYLNILNSYIWLLMLISILLISKIISLNVSRQNEQKKSFWNLNLNLIFDYLNMLMTKQPSFLLTKLSNRHFLMYFIPILSILFANVITSDIFSNMISPQYKWCKTLDCFANSKIKFFIFYNSNTYIMNLINSSNQWQFKEIVSRLNVQREKG